MRRTAVLSAFLFAGVAQAGDRPAASKETILKLIDRNAEIPRTRALNFEAPELTPSKIWIHIRSPAQHADAATISAMLQDGVHTGNRTRGVTLLPAQEVAIGPDAAQVRFFKEEDHATANEIARRLTAAGMPTTAESFVEAFKDTTVIDVGHIEIWLPDGETFLN